MRTEHTRSTQHSTFTHHPKIICKIFLRAVRSPALNSPTQRTRAERTRCVWVCHRTPQGKRVHTHTHTHTAITQRDTESGPFFRTPPAKWVGLRLMRALGTPLLSASARARTRTNMVAYVYDDDDRSLARSTAAAMALIILTNVPKNVRGARTTPVPTHP